jgi:glyoxylase-like metal-dependent hydrolase (beta-lactamase superfamily II)
MKTIVSLLLLSCTLQAFEYNLVPQKLTSDVYCFFGKPENISKENGGNMVNTCFVQTKEGFVVIDSGPTYGYASQAYVQMQKIAKLPVKYVVNTHDHDDHWLGNSFYKEKGALLIGPETYEQNVVPGMNTRMERELGKEIFNKTTIVALDKVVKSDYSFTLGGKQFEVKKVVDKAHTSGDLIVMLPEEGVVFAGDLVFNDRVTSIRDGSINGAIKALNVLDKLDVKIIVGGHGYRTDKNATALLKHYLEEMKTEILSAMDEDISLNEITQKVVMPKYKKLKLYDMLHRRNVLDAYRELEFDSGEEEE